jgi:hypothetical protein
VPSLDTERPFLGRDGEVETLIRALGRGRLMLVTGEAGIGKTRLAEEFAAHAAAGGAQVRWGRCWEGDGAPAFWPWIEVLRSHARETDDDTLRAQLGAGAADVALVVEELRARFPELSEPQSSDSKQSRFRLFDAITCALKNAAAARPLVVILEDLHWADAPSLLLLRFVARELEGTSLLVVATFRDGEVAPGAPAAETIAKLARYRACERMPLGGLREDDVHRYVELVLGGDAAARLTTPLHRETDGNPFFLGEIVRLLAREPAPAKATPPFALPETVRDVIARRLAAHTPECLDMLRVAAVVGRTFTLAALGEVPDLADAPLLDLVSAAIDGRLLTAAGEVGGAYRFTHSLIRETLYDALPLAQRAELHWSVGEALAALHHANLDTHAAELAHHFMQAAVRDGAERAIEYAVRAGEHATRMLAHEEAAAHHTRALLALEQWRPADESRACTILLALGESRVRAGDPTGAEDAFVRAAALARRLDAPQLLGRAALGLGEVERFQDRLGSLLEDALERLGPDDSKLRVRLLTRLAVALYWSPRDGRKTALSAEAVAMARRLDHTSTLAYALAGRIATLSGPDDVEQRLAAATEMRRLAERCADRELAMVGRGWSIADALALGRITDVRREIDAFTASARELRHPYFMWWATAMAVMRTILEGRFAEAETLANEALRLGQRAIVADAAQAFAGHLYVLCIEQERLEQLEAVAQAFVEQFPLVPSGHCGLALLHAEQGRVADAEAEIATLAADDFAMLPRNPEWLSCVAGLAEASALVPSAPSAATLYALLAPYGDRVIVAGLGVLCAGSVAHFLGMLATRLGHFAAAAEHLETALRVHAAIGSPPWTAYSHCEYTRLALARRAPGDRERAERARAAALEIAERLGMKRLRRRVAALAAEAPHAATTPRTAVLRREGDYWTVRWDRAEFRLRDSVGLQYLATLLGNPTRDFLAIDLVTTCRTRRADEGRRNPTVDPTLAARADGDLAPLVDRRARHAYRRRLEDLRAELAEAEAFNEVARASHSRAEIEALSAELARAFGVGDRDRPAGSPLERARVSVTRAIRHAVQRIGRNDDDLGRHLATTIKTGTFCSYSPDTGSRISWES